MALQDLLWACPECGEDRGLRPREAGPEDGARNDDVVCRRCATRFRRHAGARILARPPDGPEVVRSAAEWVDRLPDVASLLEGEAGEGEALRVAGVEAAFVVGHDTVRGGGRYLNRIERFGPEARGTLRLERDRLVLAREEEAGRPGASGRPESWPGDRVAWEFDALAAVQASSRTLQVRGGGHPLASFRFLDDSIFLWEQLLAAALRDFYRRTGRGEILELQPRICVR